ncbi:MAG: hypothetical protein QOE89_740 [Pseudonocardiales bacterium]|nr:hypothetical protein [Pseudonocardiales bacterium]
MPARRVLEDERDQLATRTEERDLAAPGVGDSGGESLAYKAREALGAPLIALLAGWAVLAYRSPYSGIDLFRPASWGRWDSGHYARIAQDGYTASWHCSGHSLPPHLPPGNYLCGTIGWFPGYPALGRLISWLPGVTVGAALLAIAWVGWFLVLVLMWRLLADARSVWTRRVCLAVATFAPAQVYFAALFPISMCIAGILGCSYAAFRTTSRTALVLGVLGGLVAGFSYFTAVVTGPAIIVAALISLRGRRRLRALACGLAPLVGFGGVLLTMQISVGIWNAYFISAKKYGIAPHSPLQSLRDHLRPMWTYVPPERYLLHIEAQQTMLALCLVAAGTLVTVASWFAIGFLRTGPELTAEGPPDRPAARSRLDRVARVLPAMDLALLMMAVGTWLVPYVAGGGASTYRSEAFVVLSVPLLRRVPWWLLIIPLAAGVYVAWRMAPNFFNGKLV